MSGEREVRQDMTVVGPDERVLGPIDDVHGDGFDVQGFHIGHGDVEAVEQGTVQLADTERVHVVERRLEAEEQHGVNAPPDAGFEGVGQGKPSA